MIFAKLKMAKMPEHCFACEERLGFGRGNHCGLLGMWDGDIKDVFTRLPACPLVEIDIYPSPSKAKAESERRISPLEGKENHDE